MCCITVQANSSTPATASQKPGEVDSPSITAETKPSDEVRIASSAVGSMMGPTPATRTAIGPSHAHSSPLARWRSQRSPVTAAAMPNATNTADSGNCDQ